MLPRPLYECIPYLSILLAGVILALPTGLQLLWVALPLFVAGSWIWVVRSKHRRPDRVRYLLDPDSLLPHYRHRAVPVQYYECLPFAYLAAGGCALVSLEPLLGQLSGGLLVIAGGAVWRMRHIHRMRPAFVMVMS